MALLYVLNIADPVQHEEEYRRKEKEEECGRNEERKKTIGGEEINKEQNKNVEEIRDYNFVIINYSLLIN